MLNVSPGLRALGYSPGFGMSEYVKLNCTKEEEEEKEGQGGGGERKSLVMKNED